MIVKFTLHPVTGFFRKRGGVVFIINGRRINPDCSAQKAQLFFKAGTIPAHEQVDSDTDPLKYGKRPIHGFGYQP